MNDRIRELFKQAYGYSPSPIGEPEAKKFAELIVAQCAKEAFEFWCNQPDCNDESAQSHILNTFRS